MATSREMTAGPALPLIFNFTMPLLPVAQKFGARDYVMMRR